MFIDGFVLPVPKGKVAEYTKMAKAARKVWMKHGALEYREFEFEEIDQQPMVSFLKMAKAKDEETVIFAWILYKSKAHRTKVLKLVLADPAMEKMMEGKEMPFDMKRMAYGGFKAIVK